MTSNQIFETIIEGAMVLAVIFGFIFEDKLVEFEERIFKKIKRKFGKGKAPQRKESNIVVFAPFRAEQRRAAK